MLKQLICELLGEHKYSFKVRDYDRPRSYWCIDIPSPQMRNEYHAYYTIVGGHADVHLNNIMSPVSIGDLEFAVITGGYTGLLFSMADPDCFRKLLAAMESLEICKNT